MKIKQIAVCGVVNNYGTQCNAFIFALSEDGNLYWTDDKLIRGIGSEPVWAEITPPSDRRLEALERIVQLIESMADQEVKIRQSRAIAIEALDGKS